ncbi:hypothetical protein GCM10020295_77570 [Streptomyces cinereospinus]
MLRERDRWMSELERLTIDTMPAAVTLLREGNSAETVLAKLDWPENPLLRSPAESFIRELARSERRSAAAQAASAKALSRVQAKTVSMLADLREMQERHGADVFGDLLRLDHSTSQLGLMTDRLALLMGGRSSRVWNKPIVMESILRGAVGRIAAYQRVRLHNSSKAAIAGFAAEGVMHLLAELMDNAANFSPPIDEVHVYVEERSAGLVVTIEDSGLKMSDAAMRRAEEAVSGQVTDLASLQGTRLGLGVVGRIAAKYGISVNYRPSSRGGTGVVVLLPPQVVAQQREPVAADRARPGAEVTAAVPAPAAAAPVRPQVVAPADAAPRADASRRPVAATENGLPVRAPGHTMAEAERRRPQASAESARQEPGAPGAARDAGSRFGAFHRGRQAGGPSEASSPPTPPAPADPRPPPGRTARARPLALPRALGPHPRTESRTPLDWRYGPGDPRPVRSRPACHGDHRQQPDLASDEPVGAHARYPSRTRPVPGRPEAVLDGQPVPGPGRPAGGHMFRHPGSRAGRLRGVR